MRYVGPRYDDWDELYGLIRGLFGALSITCFLYAMHRIANGVTLGSRVNTLSQFSEAYTPEERETLIHIIKKDSLKF